MMADWFPEPNSKLDKFITFEGIDGVGKTTVIQLVQEYLEQNNIKVYITREPGGCKIAEDIRTVLKDNFNDLSEETNLLLMFAARNEHNKVIREKLEEGYVVLCDRYVDSTIAYQGSQLKKYAINKDLIELLKITTKCISPEITFLLDADLSVLKERTEDKSEMYDSSIINLKKMIRAEYRKLAEINYKRIRLIDANGTVENTFNQIRFHLDKII